MANRQLTIVGAVGGLLFAPLLAASVTAFDLATPELSTSAEEFAAQLRTSEGALRGTAFLWALTGVAFLLFSGSVYSGTLKQRGREWLSALAFGAGALWAFTWVLAGLIMNAARSFVDSSSEGATLAKTALAISRNLHFSHDLLLAAVFVGAASLAIPAGAGFRSLVKKSGVGAAVLFVLGSAALAVGQPFPILPLGQTIFLAWMVGTSILLIRDDFSI